MASNMFQTGKTETGPQREFFRKTKSDAGPSKRYLAHLLSRLIAICIMAAYLDLKTRE